MRSVRLGGRAVMTAILAWSLAAGCRSAESPAPFERLAAELMDELAERRRLDTGKIAFDGDVVAYTPLGASRFTVHVEKDGPHAVVTSEGAPWFVPRQVTLTLGNPAQLLDRFALAFEGADQDDGGSYLRLSGRHRSPALHDARFVRVWIDVVRREVARIELMYLWGTVLSEFQYATLLGRTVVALQRVHVEPMGLVLHVAYRNFRWPEPDSPDPPAPDSRQPPGPTAPPS